MYLGQGVEDATSTGSHGGDGRGQQGLSKHQGVGESQGGLAEGSHNSVGDAVAQAGLDEATGQPVGDGDQPTARQRLRLSRS